MARAIKRVMLLGATAMLGYCLRSYLERLGYECIGVGRASAPGVEVVLDPLCEAHLSSAITEFKPSSIINLIALTNVDECERDLNAAFAANVLCAEVAANCVVRTGCGHLIQISTDHVYAGGGPNREAQVEIVNNYAMTKYAGELAALRAGASVLRTNFICKSKVKGRLSLLDWAYNELTAKRPIYGFNNILFNPVTIQTLAETISFFINERPAGVYNVGSSEGMSKYRFLSEFAGALKLDSDLITSKGYENSPRGVRRPLDMRMNCEKLHLISPHTQPTLNEELAKLTREYL